MSAIIYIGPIEADDINGCGGVDGDTRAPLTPRAEAEKVSGNEQRTSRFDSCPQPLLLTQRIRHDYAYLADRPVDIFNSDKPVMRCERCLKVAMTTIVVTVTVFLYVLGYLQKVGAQ